MTRRPNVLLVLSDQERAEGAYDPPGMARFRAEQLPSRRALAESGISFAAHRIASAACVPSRVSLLTGTTPHVHGVKQTDGFAKHHDDPAMRWLSPDRLPTLGHRFRAHGYESVYVGKWHLSQADLRDARGRALGPGGGADAAYARANRLAPHGFDGWIGPEPHGADVRNAGVFRDEAYVRQASAWLRARAADEERRPFLLVVSLVNPHDIVFWPAWSVARRALLELEGIPELGEAPTEREVSRDEPAVLRAYRERYPLAYGPRAVVNWLYRRDPESYRRFYASLLRRSDAHLGALLSTLAETRLAESTAVVFSSDHGELLGAHGGLHQKWYNAYEETLRVPLVVRSPDHAASAGRVVDALSSHLDLVPTLLGLAGLDTTLPGGVAERFAHVPALPGRDVLRDPAPSSTYFVTEDDVLEGDHRESAFTRLHPALGASWSMRYASMGVPNTATEAVVGDVASPGGGPTRRYKLIRTYRPGDGVRASDEWNLFDLVADPCERVDLAHRADHGAVREALARDLAGWRARGVP